MEFNELDIIEPVNREFFSDKLGNDQHLLFNKIRFPEKRLPDTKIALLGIGEDLSLFRESLYSTYYAGETNISDLGNLPKHEENKLSAILKVLLDNNIFTILVGNSANATETCFEALANTGKKNLSVSLVLQSLKQFPAFVTEKPECLFNLNVLGYQTYLSNPEKLDFMLDKYYEALRLGKFRENNRIYEPPLRDSDLLSIDIASVRRADAGDSEYSGVNGLYAEEICQIGQYAGMSENLKIVHLYCQNKIEKKGQINELFAQIIWYIADGFTNRRNEIVLNNVNGITKFLVNFRALSEPLVFYHSYFSNRWWMEITCNSDVAPLIISCDKEDYESAKNGDLPIRWIWYQQKMVINI